jgi:nucleoside-diphosphate-sugar epimerase
MPKIAVLGGSGYLASLLKKQNNIKRNKFFFFSRKKNSRNYLTKQYYHKKLRKYDFIIHLIGPSQKKINSKKNLLQEKNRITSIICDICLNNNIKLIYISSLKVYKNYGLRNILKNSKLNLGDFYSKAHFDSEKIIVKKFKKHENMFTILRLGNVFGFQKYLNLDELNGNIVHSLCKSAIEKKKIILKNAFIQRAFVPSKIFVDIINQTIIKKFFNNSIRNINYKVYNLKELAYIIKKRIKKILNFEIKVLIINYKLFKKFLVYQDQHYKLKFNNNIIYNEIDQILKKLK